ncbi:MAG: peptidyl-prolyl cis-trans isomerase [Desulfobacterales bacterium]|nr:peptidyl-prolyl cis-trans isomerase [Desulfobacterales bacterium]
MNKKLGMGLLAGAVLIGALCVWGCQSPKDPLVAFDGGCLTVQDLDAHYEKLKSSSTFKNRTEQLTPEFVFDHAVNMEMIITRGLKEKLHQDPRIRAQIHAYMSDLFLKIMQDELVPQINKNDFTEDELKAFYEENKESYTTPAMLSVRMIKTDDENTALKAKHQIASGNLDFIRAAAQYSTDTKTAGRGGDIGTRALRKFKSGWRDVIGGLEPDVLSGPYQIQDNWFLFELMKKTTPVVHSFEEKQAYIRNDLLYNKYRQAWRDTYDQLRKEYEVKVDQDQLDNFIRERTGGKIDSGDTA